jgi:primosomal protein N' (replication factor Y)
MGLGMEKLKEVVEQEFPEIRVSVLKDSSYQLLEEELIKLHDDLTDVIISSDVFSRSIINNDIDLVGIINIDLVTKAPSHHSKEKAYSMLKHASMHLTNEYQKLIIQTYNPEESILKHFILDEYDKFFLEELKSRELLKLDPLYEINRIFVKAEYKEMYKTANIIRKHLYNTIKYNIQVLGPAYNKTERCVQLIVKHQNKKINDVYNQIYKLYQNSKTMIIFDKYPRSI